MRKLKIAIFTDSFIPIIDGVVTATLGLAKGLADRGHKVYIIAPVIEGLRKEFSYPNIAIKRLKSIPAFFYKGYKLTNIFSVTLMNFFRKEKIDIIHFQTPLTIGLQGIFISKLLRVPLIGTFHTLFTDLQYLKNAKMDYTLIELMTWFYARLFYRDCNLITVPSKSTKKELIEHGFTPPIKVVSNGIDFKIFQNNDCKKVRKKYLDNDQHLLLFVGRIAHGKNIPYLLDCFKLVLEKLPSTRLLIVGGGPQFKEIKDEIKKMKLKEKVILTGKIEHDEFVKSSILGACDLFVTASTTETQGITTLEAQANGLPCIGINERGIKDIIKNNYNGYLAQFGDKKEFADRIIKLLTNKKLYEAMKKNTLQEIKKQDISNIIDIWEENYYKLIKNYNSS